MNPGVSLLVACAALALGCGANDARHRAQVTHGVKAYVTAHVALWLAAAEDLQRAAPLPTGRGWSPAMDAPALAAMKSAWMKGRWSYELVEGAIAPLFPESDVATDARYEDYLLITGPTGDPDPFDGRGVVGMHGIERILYAPETPAAVREFERGLPGYRPAGFPSNDVEARSFKDGLAGSLVAEIRKLQTQLAPLEPDLSFAYEGLMDLVREQVEKVDKTASGEEESRYARMTLRDLRANHRGAADVYELFRPWLHDKRGGVRVDQEVREGFARIEAALGGVTGDAMPMPPATWSRTKPTGADLRTPFGLLYQAVKRECDEEVAGSLLASLRRAGQALALELP